MELILLIGIPGSGKSDFYVNRFLSSHIHFIPSMFKMHEKYFSFFEVCLNSHVPLILDSSVLTFEERARFIKPAKNSGYKVIGYYFKSSIKDALKRNERKPLAAQAQIAEIVEKHHYLQIPGLNEGFNELYYVRINSQNKFMISEWK